MTTNAAVQNETRAAGYEALIEHFDLRVIPNWHRSFVGPGGRHTIQTDEGHAIETYPSGYWPGDRASDHLEFALKYDGTNLAILSKVFQVISAEELAAYIETKPTGKYSRRLWFLYEYLKGEKLPLEDLQKGTYLDLLDPAEYFALDRAEKSSRQRIKNNLPGNSGFCPLIRRTDTLMQFEEKDLPGRCREVLSEYPADLLRRALAYLYTKETKSSFEIERITPSADRAERFIAQLENAWKEDYCTKAKLIDLQNRIVDERFKDTDYRTLQNYVGQSVSAQREIIHFITPKPEDLAKLMDGLIRANKAMEAGNIPPVIQAAAIGFGFVFLHPFEDGNGRIHRFLLHNILARRGYTPEGLIFPISAAMVKDRIAYDKALEAFSKAVMPLLDYELSEDGRLTVHNESAIWYRFMDMTAQAEALYRFIEETIETELVQELAFLTSYDKARTRMQAIVDMPDRLIDLFIRICLQNKGQLSKGKRGSHFEMLTDKEIAALERAVREEYDVAAAEYQNEYPKK